MTTRREIGLRLWVFLFMWAAICLQHLPARAQDTCGADQFAAADVAILAVGLNHGCAAARESGLRCWGENGRGQLGIGSQLDSAVPVDVSFGSARTFTALASSRDHTCAIDDAGLAWCWGFNSWGQLGDGSTTDSNTPIRAAAGGPEKIDIATGRSHTCAANANGTVSCWGLNAEGQLGISGATDSSNPQTVSGLPAGDPAVSVALGREHSCTLTEGGFLWCWGAGARGQLGDGSASDSSEPVQVPLASVDAVAAGDRHTCALRDGEVFCWGANGTGQLGDGKLVDQDQPVKVPLPAPASAITAGEQHGCAILAGTPWCWGLNTFGQLGDGTTTTRTQPVEVISAPGPATAISAGANHTCILGTNRQVWCWGLNADGQLGDGTLATASEPVESDGASLLVCEDCPFGTTNEAGDPIAGDVTSCEAICGDGYVVPGLEQCDGGTEGADCCTASCQFAAATVACGDGSDTACSAPDTCDGAGSCQPNHAGADVPCRDALGECDAPEFCDGDGSCPADFFVAAGVACSDDDNECTRDACDGKGTCDHPPVAAPPVFGPPEALGHSEFNNRRTRWADLDGDSDLDAVTYGSRNGTLYLHWYENRGENDAIRRTIGALVSSDQLAHQMFHLGDFDGDGDVDVVGRRLRLNSGFVNSQYLYIRWNRLNTNQGWSTNSIPLEGRSFSHFRVVDLDGNGNDEIVVFLEDEEANAVGGTRVERFIEVWGKAPGGAFSRLQRDGCNGALGSCSWFRPHGVTDVDYNGDGDRDLVTWRTDDTLGPRLFFYNGSLEAESYAVLAAPGCSLRHAHAADLDADGDEDLVFTCFVDDEFSIRWYRNSGSEFPGAPEIIAETSSPQAIHVADLDGDERLDIVVSHSGRESGLSWWRNEGSAFSGPYLELFGEDLRGTFIADYDDDGDADLLLDSANGPFAWSANAPAYPVCADDGSECTSDVCMAGSCTHGPLAAGAACGDDLDSDCSAPDTCDGSGTCLTNHAEPNSPCGDRNSTTCSAADTCDGAGTCLANHAAPTVICRADRGDCDIADTCDGAGFCGEDEFESEGTACGDASDSTCDRPDTCDGAGTCRDNFEPGTLVCRGPSTECDLAEYCDGAGGCPIDAFVPVGTACGDGGDTTCSAPDTCDGAGSCLANHADPTVVCRADRGECDIADTCDGAGACGEDEFESEGTACGDASDSICDRPDSCDGAGSCRENLEPETVPCRETGEACDVTEYCDGAGQCPADVFKPSGTICDDGLYCTASDSCDGGGTCLGVGDPCPQIPPLQKEAEVTFAGGSSSAGSEFQVALRANRLALQYPVQGGGGSAAVFERQPGGTWAQEFELADDLEEVPVITMGPAEVAVFHKPAGEYGQVRLFHRCAPGESGTCDAVATGTWIEEKRLELDWTPAHAYVEKFMSLSTCPDGSCTARFALHRRLSVQFYERQLDGTWVTEETFPVSPAYPNAQNMIDFLGQCAASRFCAAPEPTAAGCLDPEKNVVDDTLGHANFCMLDAECGYTPCLFGYSTAGAVDLDGDRLVMSSAYPGRTAAKGRERVYVFDRVGDGWRQSARLEAEAHDFRKCNYVDRTCTSDADCSGNTCGNWPTYRFGASVALEGRTVVVGAPRATGDRGSVHLFEETEEGTWEETELLAPTLDTCIGAGDPFTCCTGAGAGTCAFADGGVEGYTNRFYGKSVDLSRGRVAIGTERSNAAGDAFLFARKALDSWDLEWMASESWFCQSDCAAVDEEACSLDESCHWIAAAAQCQPRTCRKASSPQCAYGDACSAPNESQFGQAVAIDGAVLVAVRPDKHLNQTKPAASVFATAECRDFCNEEADSCTAPVGTSCGPDAIDCRLPDTCNAAGFCETGAVAMAGTPCGEDGTDCRAADSCSATGYCRAGNAEPDGSVCAAGAASGTCVQSDGTCLDGTCAGTIFKSEGTPCGPGDGECSGAETCDGAGACLPNHAAAGTPCGDGATDCSQADICDGAGACLPRHLPAGTACGSSGDDCRLPDACDEAGECTPGEFLPPGTACGDRADTTCSAPDTCNGSGACQANHSPASMQCGLDLGECDLAEFCDGSGACEPPAFAPAGARCGDGRDDACDSADTCDGAGSCEANFAAPGSAAADLCDDGLECTIDRCDGNGSCENAELDRDGDTVFDCSDNCLDTPNSSQSDIDGDAVGDSCDNCEEFCNPDQLDTDEDCSAPGADPGSCGDVCDPCPAFSEQSQSASCQAETPDTDELCCFAEGSLSVAVHELCFDPDADFESTSADGSASLRITAGTTPLVDAISATSTSSDAAEWILAGRVGTEAAIVLEPSGEVVPAGRPPLTVALRWQDEEGAGENPPAAFNEMGYGVAWGCDRGDGFADGTGNVTGENGLQLHRRAHVCATATSESACSNFPASSCTWSAGSCISTGNTVRIGQACALRRCAEVGADGWPADWGGSLNVRSDDAALRYCCDPCRNQVFFETRSFSGYAIARQVCDGVQDARVLVTKLHKPEEQLVKISGIVPLAEFNPAHYPADTTSASLAIANREGRTLLEANLPAGAFHKADKQGWIWNGKGTTLKWKSGSGLDGIRKLVIKSSPKRPGKATFLLLGKGVSLPLSSDDLPLALTIEFAAAGRPQPECAATEFRGDPADCELKGKGTKVDCRQQSLP